MPFGLRPVNRLGAPYPHSMREYAVNTSTPAMGLYDPVIPQTDGSVNRITNPTQTPVGVFLGYRTTTTTGINSPYNIYYPGSVAGFALIGGIDPDTVYQVECSTSLAAADVHNNARLTTTAPSATSGLSQVALDVSTLNPTQTSASRIVGLAPIVGNDWGVSANVVEVILTNHFYRQTAGV